MVYRQTARSERVRAASRARMLAAARKLFLRKGYTATTIRDIAAAADTSIGNLYFYFATKDELLATLLAEARGPVWAWVEAAEAAVPPGPARLAISTWANVLRLITTDRDLMRLFATKGIPPGLTDRTVNEYLVHLRARFRENLPGFPEEDLELALSAWAGAMRRTAERHACGDFDGDPMMVAEFLVRWNLRGLGVSGPEIEAAVAVASQAVREGGSPLPVPRSGTHDRSGRTVEREA